MGVRANREPAQRERERRLRRIPRAPHNRLRLFRTVYPYRKPQVIHPRRRAFSRRRRVARNIEKNSILKTHTKSTAEALRTRSSPAPPCCCCGPPPRPAPVDSSWSNLEKLVSYSLCARRKPPPRPARQSCIHSSFDALARVVARPRRRRRRRRGQRWEKPGSSSSSARAGAGAGEPS